MFFFVTIAFLSPMSPYRIHFVGFGNHEELVYGEWGQGGHIRGLLSYIEDGSRTESHHTGTVPNYIVNTTTYDEDSTVENEDVGIWGNFSRGDNGFDIGNMFSVLTKKVSASTNPVKLFVSHLNQQYNPFTIVVNNENSSFLENIFPIFSNPVQNHPTPITQKGSFFERAKSSLWDTLTHLPVQLGLVEPEEPEEDPLAKLWSLFR
jgi:hypothetical protein